MRGEQLFNPPWGKGYGEQCAGKDKKTPIQAASLQEFGAWVRKQQGVTVIEARTIEGDIIQRTPSNQTDTLSLKEIVYSQHHSRWDTAVRDRNTRKPTNSDMRTDGHFSQRWHNLYRACAANGQEVVYLEDFGQEAEVYGRSDEVYRAGKDKGIQTRCEVTAINRLQLLRSQRISAEMKVFLNGAPVSVDDEKCNQFLDDVGPNITPYALTP